MLETGIAEAVPSFQERFVPRAYIQQHDMVIASAEGAHVVDANGHRLIDFTSGFGVTTIGHNDPAVVKAIREQAERLVHTGPALIHQGYLALAKRLAEQAPGDESKQVLLASSGAESVENAIKLARYATGRSAVVAFDRAYHGRTFLASSLNGRVQPYKRQPGPMAPEIFRAPFPYPYRPPLGVSASQLVDHCVEALYGIVEHQVDAGKVGAVILEPIQGEGGCIVPPAGFVLRVQEFCRSIGAILIVDEILTGLCRTGPLFACESDGVVPDVLVIGKTLGGGLPLGAVIARRDLFERVEAGDVGGTYGGNPLACAAGLAVLESLQPTLLLPIVEAIEGRIRSHIDQLVEDLPTVGELRGRGTMFGIELVTDPKTRKANPELARDVVEGAGARGLILVRTGEKGHVLRLLVPTCVDESTLEEGLGIVTDVIRQTSKRQAS